jgi:hypothetical protein
MKQQARRTGLTTWSLTMAAALAATASADAQQQLTADAHAVTAPAGKVRQVQALGVRPESLRSTATWVYNTLDCPECNWGYNLSWADPDCFFDGGAGCSGELYPLPLNTTPVVYDGEVLQAPVYDDGQGNNWATDVIFDDYLCDEDTWGYWYQRKPLVAFSTVAWTYNDYDSGVDKTYVFRCAWLSADGRVLFGERAWELQALSGENVAHEVTAGTLDEPLDPVDAFDIDPEGILCLDYDNQTLEGHDDGGAFAFLLGGDLWNPAFPYPSDLYEVGYNDPTDWAAGGYDDPNVIPDWDGDPALTAIDLLNTGTLVNWDFASDAGQLAHGYPAKMGISGAGRACGDLDGDGDVDMSDGGILLSAFGLHDGGDVDGDGDTDQQDLAWFLTQFGCYNNCGPCEPIGTGTMEVDLVPVDNTSVGPGDDPEHPDFDGGVTHFTFDIVAVITADNDWTTQSSSVQILHPDVSFFNHSYGHDAPSNPALFQIFPALPFDSFYARPPELFNTYSPGFAFGPDWTDTTVEAVWWDTPEDEDCIATTQRLTLIVPANSGIEPAVLPDCHYELLARISADATAKSTGADLLHRDFLIGDLAKPRCVGDVDGDGLVGQADLGTLLATYNRRPDDPAFDIRADFDCDGDIDQSDLGALLANYGGDC